MSKDEALRLMAALDLPMGELPRWMNAVSGKSGGYKLSYVRKMFAPNPTKAIAQPVIMFLVMAHVLHTTQSRPWRDVLTESLEAMASRD